MLNNFELGYFMAVFCQRILNAKIELEERKKNTVEKIASLQTDLLIASRKEVEENEKLAKFVNSLASKVNTRFGLDNQFLKVLGIELDKPWRKLNEWKRDIPQKFYVEYTYVDGERQGNSRMYSDKNMDRMEFVAKIMHTGINPVWISQVHTEPKKTQYMYNGSLITETEEEL